VLLYHTDFVLKVSYNLLNSYYITMIYTLS